MFKTAKIKRAIPVCGANCFMEIMTWDSLAREFFHVLLTVLIVIDPVGITPQFLSITARFDEQTRRSIVKKSVLIAAVVLAVFLVAGRALLSFFGIMSGTFYISGAILFFLIAFEMIYSKSGPRTTPSEDGESGVSVALFPLAIPLIAGPGLITVIIMHMSRNRPWLYSLSIFWSLPWLLAWSSPTAYSGTAVFSSVFWARPGYL